MDYKILEYNGFEYHVYPNGEIFDCDKGDLLNKTKDSNGYYIVYLGRGKSRKRKYLHRIIAEMYIDNDYDISIDKLTVNHKDYDKSNNNVYNLEWMTREENASHSYLQDHHNNIGESNKNSKLSCDDVRLIKGMLGTYDNYEIANMFCVNSKTIYDIRHNKTWKRII